MSRPDLKLISHVLCPYVQRAVILLEEKGAAYSRIDIDLAHKPDWFLAISPLEKTPVLLVNNEAIFESAVICEYLDETLAPSLHPASALERARHRSWVEFGSAVLNNIARYYSAPSDPEMLQHARALHRQFSRLESRLQTGPYFSGRAFSMIDVVFGPVFRYFDTFERYHDFAFFDSLPKVSAWRAHLSARRSVIQAVRSDYPDLLADFLRRRSSALSRRIPAV